MNTFKGAFWGSSGDRTKQQPAQSPSNEAEEPRAEEKQDDMAVAPPERQQEEPRQPEAPSKLSTTAPTTTIPCPDPSVHKKDTKLQEQASHAALYKTHPEHSATRDEDVLDSNNRLSSAGAAASLKYAKAHELPSFPSVGIDTRSSAGSAANLANSNRKSVELWHPDGVSSSAGKAAMLAKDHKMAPLWRPETSAAGPKAAMLAHREGAKVDLWRPEANKDSQSAANLAVRAKAPSVRLDDGYTPEGHRKALVAATDAAKGRPRSDSTPDQAPDYPDAANSSRNALNAATMAHRPSVRNSHGQSEEEEFHSAALEAARVRHLGHNVPREMFSEHPPVAIEVEEKRHQDALHASAVAMAKVMYDVQQKHIEQATAGSHSDGRTAALRVHDQQPTDPSKDLRQQAVQYLHLQEAAHRLAAERLAKIQPSGRDSLQDYYGINPERPKSGLSLSGRSRRRASSESQMSDFDDAAQSRRIRNQMSAFNAKVAQVDAKKRQRDRERLLAVAEKKVHAQLHAMDEKVFRETGNASPSMMQEWEARARAKAAADSEVRMANYGKVDIGGGTYIDQAQVDAVAAARVKPTLDEINETAERQRIQQEEMRLEQEERKRLAQREKEREAELKAEQKRLKEDQKHAAKVDKEIEKMRRLEEKQIAKAEREAEKARHNEEKRIEKEEKRISAETQEPVKLQEPVVQKEMTTIEPLPVPDTGPVLTEDIVVLEEIDADEVKADPAHPLSTDPDVIAERVLSEPVVAETSNRPLRTVAIRKVRDIPDSTADQEVAKSSSFSRTTTATRTDSKGFKSLIGKFKRRPKGPSETSDVDPELSSPPRKSDTTDSPGPEVPINAPFEHPKPLEVTPREERNPSPSISSLSSSNYEEDNRGRSKSRDDLIDDGRGEVEERRNEIDDELLPPPPLVSPVQRSSGSPIRDSKFQEQL